MISIYESSLNNSTYFQCLRFISMHSEAGMNSVRFICRLMCLKSESTFVDAAGLIVQRAFNAMAKMDRQKEMKPDPEVAEGKFVLFDCDYYGKKKKH